MTELDLEIKGPVTDSGEQVLSRDALAFVAALSKEFMPRVKELLALRIERQAELDTGVMPDFLESTKAIRESDWMVTNIPPDLADRRVEITGPTDRKMIINALNSGARVFMADCEDSLTLQEVMPIQAKQRQN